MKESPLHALHLERGARMVEFAGWTMPIQYSGIIKEHQAVRESAGVFDISHMGEIFVSGPGAGVWLNRMLTNQLEDLGTGQGQYTLLLNEDGGIIDDLILYRILGDEYLLVVNAACVAEAWDWLERHAGEGVCLSNRSESYGALAIQGPESKALFRRMTESAAGELPPRNGLASLESAGPPAYVCRTGYTGEDGFELFCPAEETAGWFTKAVECGASPCGLGARDTLRLEMGYPLNGSDLSPDRTPLEAGLGFFVDLEKEEFMGREALLRQKEAGDFDRLTAIRMLEKGPPPRPHYAVYAGDDRVGELSSGTLSPSLGVGIGMAYLPTQFSAKGSALEVEMRAKRFPATVVKKPFLTTG